MLPRPPTVQKDFFDTLKHVFAKNTCSFAVRRTDQIPSVQLDHEEKRSQKAWNHIVDAVPRGIERSILYKTMQKKSPKREFAKRTAGNMPL